MFKKLVLATTLGLSLFGVSYAGQVFDWKNTTFSFDKYQKENELSFLSMENIFINNILFGESCSVTSVGGDCSVSCDGERPKASCKPGKIVIHGSIYFGQRVEVIRPICVCHK